MKVMKTKVQYQIKMINSSRDKQLRYYSNNKFKINITKKKYDALPYIARSDKQDLSERSDKLDPSDRKRTFNPKDILQQRKVINPTEITKPGIYIDTFFLLKKLISYPTDI